MEQDGPVSNPHEIDANPRGEGLARVIRVGIAAFVVVLVVAMFPLSPRPAIDIKIVIYQIAAALFAGIWLCGVLAGRVPLTWPRMFGPVLVFMLFRHAVSLAPEEFHAVVVLDLSRTFCLMMLFLVASQVYATTNQVRPVLIAVCIGVGLSTVYAFAQRAGIDPFPWDAEQQETATYLEMPGTFGNPNIAGHALILALIFAGYLTTVRSTRWCVLFIPLFLSHLYLTHFRAGLLALASGVAVAVLASLVIRFRRPPYRTAQITVTVALAGAAAAFALVAAYVYVAPAKNPLLDDSLLLRYNAYYGAAAMIAERPIDGFGPGMYAIENPPYWTEYEQRWLAEKHLLNRHVHSDVLEAWVETGIGGALAYVLFLLIGVYGSIRFAAQSEGETRRFALMMAAFFATFATDGLFGFNSRVPVTGALLFLMAGLLEAACRVPPLSHRRRKSLRKQSSGSVQTSESTPPPAAARVCAVLMLAMLIVTTTIGGRDFLAKAFAQSAKNALAFGAHEAADRYSATAIRMAPHNTVAHVVRADVELQLGAPDRAIDQLELALAERPNDIPILLALARAHMASATNGAKVGDRDNIGQALKRAEDAANRALALCPYLPDALENLGRATLAAAQLGEDEQPNAQRAETRFLDALRNGGENVSALFTLMAECRLIARDEQGAEDYLIRAVENDPAAVDPWNSYLQLVQRTGRFDGLNAALETAIKQAESRQDHEVSGRLRARRAGMHLLAGQPIERAADEFDRALQAAPNVADVWAEYALAARGSALEARFLDRVREVTTTLPNVAALKLAFTSSSSKPVEAASTLHELAGLVMSPGYTTLQAEDVAWTLDYVQDVTLDPAVPNEQCVQGLAHVAAANELLEQRPEALATYRLIVDRASGPTYIAAAGRAGSLMIELNQFDEAVALLDIAVKKHRNNVPLRLEYARALNAAGKPALARMELNDLRARFNLNGAQQAAVAAGLDALSR